MKVNFALQLNPREKQMYGIAKGFIKVARNLERKCVSLKKRVSDAEKMSRSPQFLRTSLNEVTYNFVLSQLKNQKVSPKGRRFSLNDKILALTLLKNSPKCYRLLRAIFFYHHALV